MIHLLVQERLEDIRRLARAHHVQRLELFGSATRATFDPERSDLDFLVEFQPLPPVDYAEAYFGFREELMALLGRPVDLVVAAAIENPYFLRAIESSRTLLYVA